MVCWAGSGRKANVETIFSLPFPENFGWAYVRRLITQAISSVEL